MNDMNSFERRLTAELEHTAGPRRPVDARAIRQAATASAGRFHRWWPLPRTTKDTPTTNQHVAVQTGRTTIMFSATKLVAGAAILALAGGFLYSGVVTIEPDHPAPAGAEAERTDFIIVNGTSTITGGGGSAAGDDSMSDPRASGHAYLTLHYLTGDEDLTGVQWGQYNLSNDGGAWEGEWIGFYESPSVDESPSDRPMVGAENVMIWASGTGDYEGWSYVANYTGDLGALTVRGLMYEDDIPPTVALGLLETE